jgi:glycosyltransferase involved in cell wall biosynthesis
MMDNVSFTGRINDVTPFLCAADIFVMPSDFEGMPNAMMEAMAYGLPCISTNRTGALDVARDNLEALYVDVGSVEQLGEKLNYLIARPDERKRLGQNARERIKKFSVDNMVRLFDKHLEEMIRG